MPLADTRGTVTRCRRGITILLFFLVVRNEVMFDSETSTQHQEGPTLLTPTSNSIAASLRTLSVVAPVKRTGTRGEEETSSWLRNEFERRSSSSTREVSVSTRVWDFERTIPEPGANFCRLYDRSDPTKVVYECEGVPMFDCGEQTPFVAGNRGDRGLASTPGRSRRRGSRTARERRGGGGMQGERRPSKVEAMAARLESDALASSSSSSSPRPPLLRLTLRFDPSRPEDCKQQLQRSRRVLVMRAAPPDGGSVH